MVGAFYFSYFDKLYHCKLSNPQMKTRPIEKEDVEALARIYMRAFAQENTGEIWTLEAAANLISYWHSRQSDLSYLAFRQEDQKIVGAFLVGVKPWWDGNHLVDGEIFVDPDFQKTGVATLLLQEVLLKAKLIYNPVCFQTYTFGDSKPLSWYKRLGFEEIKHWTMIKADFSCLLKNIEQNKK